MVGCPVVSVFLIVTLPWRDDQIQQLVLSYILYQSSQISRGKSPWSLIREIVGTHLLVEKQYRLSQYLPSDVGTPNPRGF